MARLPIGSRAVRLWADTGSLVRLRLPGVTLRSPDLVRSSQFHGVLHQPQTVVRFGGENRFRVELHGFDRQLSVANAHDYSIRGFGGHFQACRERFAPRKERMVAAHRDPTSRSVGGRVEALVSNAAPVFELHATANASLIRARLRRPRTPAGLASRYFGATLALNVVPSFARTGRGSVFANNAGTTAV